MGVKVKICGISNAADARGGAAGVPGDGFLVGFPACEEQEDAKVFR